MMSHITAKMTLRTYVAQNNNNNNNNSTKFMYCYNIIIMQNLSSIEESD